MFKRILLLTCLFAANSPVHSAIDVTPIKKHVIKYCSQEPTKKLIRDCLGRANANLEIFNSIAEMEKGKELIAKCYGEIGGKSNVGWYYLLNCTSEHAKLMLSSPIPSFSDIAFHKKELRAEWLSACVKDFGHEIGGCLKKKEHDFASVWSFYLSLSSEEHSSDKVGMFQRCVPPNYINANYRQIKACLKI